MVSRPRNFQRAQILDFQDCTTCVLCRDGAGAMILEAEGAGTRADSGVLSVDFNSEGATADILYRRWRRFDHSNGHLRWRVGEVSAMPL